MTNDTVHEMHREHEAGMADTKDALEAQHARHHESCDMYRSGHAMASIEGEEMDQDGDHDGDTVDEPAEE